MAQCASTEYSNFFFFFFMLDRMGLDVSKTALDGNNSIW
jgi:hypothetical protein